MQKTGNIKNFKYMLFDVNGLIILMKKNIELTISLENTIKTYRKEKDFKLLNLINEDINYYPYNVLYFIIYKNNEIITTSRLIYKNKNGYINLVYTNPEYRNQKLCFTNLTKLMNLTNDLCNKYELDVDYDNLPAIKCYENIGFKFVKEHNKILRYNIKIN
jgi:RimJ/RimL family protein N-acetyltransferase